MSFFSRIILVLFSFFCVRVSFAQTYSFDNYSVEQGLSQSNVIGITQDKQGYIWLATQGGLSRFDGNTFKVITTSNGLLDNNISAMMMDNEGVIWLGYNSGLVSKYNGKEFTQVNIDTLFKGKPIYTIFQDKRGSIWISAELAGVVQIVDPHKDPSDAGNLNNYKTAEGLSDYVLSISESTSGKILFLTEVAGEVKQFDVSTKKIESYRINDVPALPLITMLNDKEGNIWLSTYSTPGLPAILIKHDPVTKRSIIIDVPSPTKQLMQDSKDRIWGATWGGGVFCFDGRKTQVYNTSNGLSSDKAYCVFEDREGNIIIGTKEKGLDIFKGERFVIYSIGACDKKNSISAVCQDGKGDMWFGTNKGLQKYVSETGEYKQIEKIDGKDISVRSIASDKQGNLWIGTENERLVKYDHHTEKFSFVDAVGDFTSKNIQSVSIDKEQHVWLATTRGFGYYDPKNDEVKIFTSKDGFVSSDPTVDVTYCDKKGNVWIGTSGKGLLRYDPSSVGTGSKAFKKFTKSDGFEEESASCIAEDIEGNIWVGTRGSGLYKYDGSVFSHYVSKNGLSSDNINLLYADDKGFVWIGTSKGLNRYNIKDQTIINYGKRDGFKSVETSINAVCADLYGNIWFGTVNGAIKYNRNNDEDNFLEPVTSITEVTTNHKNIITSFVDPTLFNKDNTFTFDYTAVCISNPEAVRYLVKLDGADDDWRPPTTAATETYPNLRPGRYTFMVKACNNLGIWNKEPVVYAFTINPPWYSTWWAYCIYITTLIVGFFMYVKLRERVLIREKQKLEQTVKERTAEVVEKNNELDSKNKDITASIRYARRIQSAIMPPDDFVKKYLPKTFIMYRPKDIVSGDFYWLYDLGDKILFASVDCTGHGVPGAFMSIVGHNLLDQIVGEHKVIRPAAILDELNKGVSDTLRQSYIDEQVRDGMDIALCMFDRKTQAMEYAGAFNPFYLIRDGKLFETKADKFPIGNFKSGEQRKFTNHSFQLQKGDTIYIFSDGYADQFGGPQGKKLKYGVFKRMLIEIQHMDMEQQGVHLAKVFDDWKLNYEQVDDVLVIGTRL